MIQEIKKMLKEGVDQKHFPGAHFGIINRGIAHASFVGYKQLEPELVPLSGDEIYDVASLTKVVSTTTLILKLIENKQLSLDTSVSSVLSWFQYPDITIYDLMTHTSGLPADIPRANTLRNREDVVLKVKAAKPLYPRGQHIIYSDIGFILLGFIIEALTEKTLHEVSQEWIFKPLNMIDTSYEPNRKRCAPTELREDTVYQGYLQGLVHDEKAFALGYAGHAGLFSTVNDLIIFMQAIFKKEFVLKPETIDLMFQVQEVKPHPEGTFLKRALGWEKPTPGGSTSDHVAFDETITHTGFTGCNLFIDRKNQIGFVMLSNAVHPKRENNRLIGYRRKIANLVYELRSKEEQ
ncbi:MAG: serine hydrolase domain-containing protein [Acholeplasmataceae bacterium]|nr:beta-lactamase family protein [Acholeplasmataceae bacterium]